VTKAVCLYVGRTIHTRVSPRPHRFSYGIFQILIDVDRVAEAGRATALMRRGRFGVFSFAERDHGDRDGAPLRGWVERQLSAGGVAASAARIRLLCFPRVLGFVFNPLSIFFIEDADGRLEAVIYEVNNTFGQTHAYVAPAAGRVCERQEADKRLYVSPFYRVEGAYRFRFTPPGERFNLVITKVVDGAPDFAATLSAARRPLTNAVLAKLFFSMPFMTLGVLLAIHWQALLLWLKRAPFGVRPPGPKSGMSLGRASPAAS
jgi:DUF1365 family protein